jgi:glucokinase
MVSFFEPLSRAVGMLHYSLGLERFIFAGGLTDALGENLRTSLIKNMPRQGWNLGQRWDDMIRLAPPDDLHALIGAAIASTFR